jgi:hypothetical protein
MTCRYSTTHTTQEAAEAMAKQYERQGVAMLPRYCDKCKRWHVEKEYNELPEWLQLTAAQAERITAKPLPEWLQMIKDEFYPEPKPSQDVPEWLKV